MAHRLIANILGAVGLAIGLCLFYIWFVILPEEPLFGLFSSGDESQVELARPLSDPTMELAYRLAAKEGVITSAKDQLTDSEKQDLNETYQALKEMDAAGGFGVEYTDNDAENAALGWGS